jgi:uncharacterized membrane protein YkoI
MRSTSATALLLLAAAALAQDWGQLAGEAKLSLAEAIDKGLAEARSGICFHAELERDKGVAAWSIDIAQGTKTCNVVLDAREGKVVEKDVEDEDHSKSVGLCKVELKAAVASALKLAPGTAVEARLLTVNNSKATIAVKVLVDDRVTLVHVDGATGEAKLHRRLPSRPLNPPEPPYTDTFRVDAWISTGRNPFFVLEPGHVLVLEGDTTKLTITVLDETKVVDGVETRVVEEREEKGGTLVEVSRNYFAIATRTNDVFYFGEDVDIYEDGKVVSHEGAWLSGRNGARFGLMMPGTPLLGARYHQEVAPGVAMDRAEIAGLDETFETPAGKFEGCLRTEESTPLEGGKETKYYAPGIGLIRDGETRLTKHGRGP